MSSAVVDTLEVKIQSDASKASESLTQLVNKLSVINGVLGSIGKTNGLKNIGNSIGSVTKNFSKISEITDASVSALDKLVGKVSELNAVMSELASNSNAIKDIGKYASEATRAMNGANSTRKTPKEDTTKQTTAVATTNTTNLDKVREEFTAIDEAINKVNANELSVRVDPSSFTKIDEDLVVIEDNLLRIGTTEISVPVDTTTLETLRDTAESIKDDFAGITIDAIPNVDTRDFKPNTAEFEEIQSTFTVLVSKIQESSLKLNDFQQIANSLKIILPTQKFLDLQNQVIKVREEYNKLAEAINNGELDINDAKIQQKLMDLADKFAQLEQQKKELAESGGALQFNTASIKEFANTFKQIWNNTPVFRTMGNLIGAMARKMADFGAQVKKSITNTFSLNRTLGKLFRSLTRTYKMLRLMLLRTMLRGAISNVGEGFNALTKYSSEFDANVSLLWNSIRQLGNSIASLAVPLINTFAQALNNVIQIIIKAVNAVNQLMSAFLGLKTWVRAKELTDDYAKSLDKANKKQKQLQGFDELNNLTTQSNATDTSNWYETLPIDDKYLDFIKKLKDMWKDGDFYKLGKQFGDWLANFLADIPWGKIRKNARKLGKSLATLINGIMDGVAKDGRKLSTLIGETIAQSLNTVFEFLYGFIHNFNWKRLGSFIAETLNGLFETIDWDLIEKTFIEGASGLADTINSFVDDFHWDNISDSIANGINTIATSLYTFFSTVDWVKLGANIGNQITQTIRKIDWEMIGRALGSIMQSAIQFFGSLIKNLKWSEVISALQKFFNGLKDEVNVGLVAMLLARIFYAKLLISFTGSIASTVFKQIGVQLASKLVASLLGSQVTSSVASAGTGLGTTFLTSLGTALSYIAVGTIVFEAVGNGINWAMNKIDPETYSMSFNQSIAQSFEAVTSGDAFTMMQRTYGEFYARLNGLNEDNAFERAMESVRNGAVLTSDAFIVLRDKFGLTLDQTRELKAVMDAYANGTLAEYDAKMQGFATANETSSNSLTKVADGVKLVSTEISSDATIVTWGEDTTRTFNNVQQGADNVARTWQKDGNEISNTFSKVNTSTNTFASNSSSKMSSFTNNTNNSVNKSISALDRLKQAFQKVIDKIKQFSNTHFNTNFSLSGGGMKGYATGGFPQSGEMFLARENGLPEMVGTMGSQTAVANNTDIVQGIANGVASANNEQNGYFSAMVGLLEIIADKEFSIGDDAIYKSWQRTNKSQNKRMGFA